MISTFQEYKEAGSYFLFYMLALGLGLSVAWDRYGKSEIKDNWMVEEAKKKIQLWPFLYSILALGLVVINPVVVLFYHKMTFITGQYYKLWSLLSVLFISAYGFVCFLSILREEKQKILLVGGFVILIGLAGSSYGLTAQRQGKEQFVEKETVLDIVKKNKEEVLILAEDSILEYVGIYEPKVKVVYGKDLYTPNLDLGIMDTYAPELLDLYEAVKNPMGCMGEIANTAAMYDCDAIIVKKFEEAPDKAGIYYKKEETANYLVYIR